VAGMKKTEWPRRTDKSRTLFFFYSMLYVFSYFTLKNNTVLMTLGMKARYVSGIC